jgi:hypothetical protein
MHIKQVVFNIECIGEALRLCDPADIPEPETIFSVHKIEHIVMTIAYCGFGGRLIPETCIPGIIVLIEAVFVDIKNIPFHKDLHVSIFPDTTLLVTVNEMVSSVNFSNNDFAVFDTFNTKSITEGIKITVGDFKIDFLPWKQRIRSHRG